MNWKNLYDIIGDIEKSENLKLRLLYNIGVLDLNSLYRKCAELLFKAEFDNYPKKALSKEESIIYNHCPDFVDSYLEGKYTASFLGKKIV